MKIRFDSQFTEKIKAKSQSTKIPLYALRNNVYMYAWKFTTVFRGHRVSIVTVASLTSLEVIVMNVSVLLCNIVKLIEMKVS
jgi:hypothetical protein